VSRAAPKSANRRQVFAWCLYDWANSAFPTVIITFVFAAYYTKAVAVDTVTGTADWGYAMSASAFVVAIAGPVFGAIADHSGRRKPWLATFTALCVVASACLWFVRPDPADALWALAVAGFANVCFEICMVFYNAMLPGLVGGARIGRVSGWGWGLGYAGGLACLVVVLFGLVETPTPLFGLAKQGSENIRAAAPMVAVWYAVFSLPLFAFVADTPASGLSPVAALRSGIMELKKTLASLRSYGPITRFLIARMIYTDGINTLFAFGGIYAAGTFGMDFAELITFAIAMNVSAGLGAAAFGWIDDWMGPKKTVMIALAGLIVLGSGLLLVESKDLFWILGVGLGLFVGPAQAASRSMMARLAPPEIATEMFGLYAFSGKATAFLGPALLGAVTLAFDSQRAGMATVVVFFGVGAALLARVPDIPSSR